MAHGPLCGIVMVQLPCHGDMVGHGVSDEITSLYARQLGRKDHADHALLAVEKSSQNLASSTDALYRMTGGRERGVGGTPSTPPHRRKRRLMERPGPRWSGQGHARLWCLSQ